MSRPRSTARTSVAKLSSVSTIFAACCVTSEPLPIATPTSACFNAAASFTASPGIGFLHRGGVVPRAPVHPDALAGLRHQPREPHLVLGSDAPEHVELRQPF